MKTNGLNYELQYVIATYFLVCYITHQAKALILTVILVFYKNLTRWKIIGFDILNIVTKDFIM